MKYNGWTNYETWNVALWLQNMEVLYDMARYSARRSKQPYNAFKALLDPNATPLNIRTPDGVRWDSKHIDENQINEMMKGLE